MGRKIGLPEAPEKESRTKRGLMHWRNIYQLSKCLILSGMEIKDLSAVWDMPIGSVYNFFYKSRRQGFEKTPNVIDIDRFKNTQWAIPSDKLGRAFNYEWVITGQEFTNCEAALIADVKKLHGFIERNLKDLSEGNQLEARRLIENTQPPEPSGLPVVNEIL